MYDPWPWCLYVWCIHYWSWYKWPWCTYVWCIYPWCLILIHACMMHISMFLDHWSWYMRVWCTKQWSWPLILKRVCMHDASMYDSGPWSWMYDACNNASFSRICVYMMLPDACMHDAYIYYSWPFTLMHVCMMHRCMMHNAQIYDSVPWSWWCMNLGRCMYIWCGTFWGPTDQRTNKAILGVGYIDGCNHLCWKVFLWASRLTYLQR